MTVDNNNWRLLSDVLVRHLGVEDHFAAKVIIEGGQVMVDNEPVFTDHYVETGSFVVVESVGIVRGIEVGAF